MKFGGLTEVRRQKSEFWKPKAVQSTREEGVLLTEKTPEIVRSVISDQCLHMKKCLKAGKRTM